MKKLKWLILVMCLVLGLSVFVACGGNDDNKGDNNTTVEATGITLAPSRALEIGQSTVLTAILEPFEATSTVTWKTSDAAIATVSTEGQNNGVAKVTAVAAGEATITATANGKSATCKITSTVHITPYYFLAGKSSALYFNWNNYSREDDITAVRVLSPVEGSNEKVFTTTIDLFAGDEFKICKLTDLAADNHWKAQIGGSEADDVTADDLKLTGAEEKTDLPCSKITDGNPPSFKVTVEGKYEITLDLTDDAPAISYKKVDDTDPVVWEYLDVVFKGSWNNGEWTFKKFGAESFDKDHLTITADIELEVADGFGVLTAPAGTTEQLEWFNSGVMHLGDGVDGITLPENAGNAACTKAGTYNVTVVMDWDTQFITSITFNSYTAPAAE